MEEFLLEKEADTLITSIFSWLTAIIIRRLPQSSMLLGKCVETTSVKHFRVQNLLSSERRSST